MIASQVRSIGTGWLNRYICLFYCADEIIRNLNNVQLYAIRNSQVFRIALAKYSLTASRIITYTKKADHMNPHEQPILASTRTQIQIPHVTYF